jgi:small subunit ribosomal protein S2
LEDVILDNTVVRELVDAGIHFGHRVGRWNPKMKPYIFCSRNSIHIINIKETLKGLLRARKYLARAVASGKDVLIVGTKRQARQPVMEQADRCDMPYVVERWLGGTLTNFRTIRSRLGRLEELEEMDAKGLMAAESKKMESTLRREMRKIQRNLGGIRKMDRLPGVLIVIDARRENIAIEEARKLGIPTICLMDTDSNPDVVDIPIPGNDDAMRAIELVLTQLVDAVLEGKSGRAESETAEETPRRSRRISTARAAETLADPAQNQEAVTTIPDSTMETASPETDKSS